MFIEVKQRKTLTSVAQNGRATSAVPSVDDCTGDINMVHLNTGLHAASNSLPNGK